MPAHAWESIRDGPAAQLYSAVSGSLGSPLESMQEHPQPAGLKQCRQPACLPPTPARVTVCFIHFQTNLMPLTESCIRLIDSTWGFLNIFT